MKCPCAHDQPEPFHRESWQRKWNAAFDKLPKHLQDEILRDPKGQAAHNFNQLLMKRNPVKRRKKMGPPWRFVKGAKPGFRKLKNIRTGKTRLIRMGARKASRRHRGNPQRQERVVVLPHGNIYWRNIPRNARVEDFGSGWVYDNKTVFWHGNESTEAQQWLRQHSTPRKIVSFNKRNPVTVRRHRENPSSKTIAPEIQSGRRRQGAELRLGDVGRLLSEDFGEVMPIDVGKRVWLKDYGLVMENNQQRDARIRKNPVTVRRLASGKFRVRGPRGVHAKGTTKTRATRQARLIRAVEHGWKPTGRPALAVRNKLKAMRKPARVGHRLFAHRKGKHWTLRTAPRGGLVIAKHLTLEQLRSRARKLSYKIRSL